MQQLTRVLKLVCMGWEGVQALRATSLGPDGCWRDKTQVVASASTDWTLWRRPQPSIQFGIWQCLAWEHQLLPCSLPQGCWTELTRAFISLRLSVHQSPSTDGGCPLLLCNVLEMRTCWELHPAFQRPAGKEASAPVQPCCWLCYAPRLGCIAERSLADCPMEASLASLSERRSNGNLQALLEIAQRCRLAPRAQPS